MKRIRRVKVHEQNYSFDFEGRKRYAPTAYSISLKIKDLKNLTDFKIVRPRRFGGHFFDNEIFLAKAFEIFCGRQ